MTLLLVDSTWNFIKHSTPATTILEVTSVTTFVIQSEDLHANSSRMDGERSRSLAGALYASTDHTDRLFGNDVRTAYHLLASVLEHESLQQGFELTATHDTDFNKVKPPRSLHTLPQSHSIFQYLHIQAQSNGFCTSEYDRNSKNVFNI